MSPGKEAEIAEIILSQKILHLERTLMDPTVRKDSQQCSALLAEDFREFGSSGRVWSRSAILDELEGEVDWQAPAVEDFALRQIAPDAVLVTYMTVRPAEFPGAGPKETLRSSLWIYREGRWQMLFHQGTRVQLG